MKTDGFTWRILPNIRRTYINPSQHRVLLKRAPGNRGPTECGTTHAIEQAEESIMSFPCLKLCSDSQGITNKTPNSCLWPSGPYMFWPLPASPVSSWVTLPLTFHSTFALHPLTATVTSPLSSHQTSQTNSHYLLSPSFHFPLTSQATKCGFSTPGLLTFPSPRLRLQTAK